MTHLADILDTAALEAQIAAGLITRRVLVGSDIAVYNYTARAAFSGTWSTETRRCRGLVADGAGRVLARPFEKFFDISMSEIPDGECLVTEKVDGSLGILYQGPDGLAITTRGDPNGWQSRAATALFNERYGGYIPPAGVTLLFEIVLPENRVVIDYGDRRDLVALAAIDIDSGRDVDLPDNWSGPTVERFDASSGSFDELVRQAEQEQDREGFVLHWPETGLRAKVKLADYLRRHRLIFATSTKTIWEALAAGRDPVAEVAGGPGELVRFVETHVTALSERHDSAVTSARDVVAGLTPAQRAERRAAAGAIKASREPGLAFLALDGRDAELERAAWRVVRPERSEAFRTEGAGE